MAFDVYVMGRHVGQLPTPNPKTDAAPDHLRHALMVARAEVEHVVMCAERAATGQLTTGAVPRGGRGAGVVVAGGMCVL